MTDLQSKDYDLTRAISKYIQLAEDDHIYTLGDLRDQGHIVIELMNDIYELRFKEADV